jgi:hypothetical protein
MGGFGEVRRRSRYFTGCARQAVSGRARLEQAGTVTGYQPRAGAAKKESLPRREALLVLQFNAGAKTKHLTETQAKRPVRSNA